MSCLNVSFPEALISILTDLRLPVISEEFLSKRLPKLSPDYTNELLLFYSFSISPTQYLYLYKDIFHHIKYFI